MKYIMDQKAFNITHDPNARSWVESANKPDTDFPVQNLPFGIFSSAGYAEPHVGIAIGDQILAVASLADEFSGFAADAARACAAPTLNTLMAIGPQAWSALRHAVFTILTNPDCAASIGQRIIPASQAKMHLPVAVRNYTDFYAFVDHAANVGKLFRPDHPLLPNYKYVPIAYHGRASSIGIGGEIIRPRGQIRPDPSQPPIYEPSRQLDLEMELGMFVGVSSAQGCPVPISRALDHIFGYCLLNDWSARDIQAWEYQPLGPFLGKNFATSISPWVVTAEALRPFRTQATRRPPSDPKPLSYLMDTDDQAFGGYNIEVGSYLRTSRMIADGDPPYPIGRANIAKMYWTVAQLLTHHSSNGCNLEVGDLFGSGTISSAAEGGLGCLLEVTRRGQASLRLPNGEFRTFLLDGDEICLKAECLSPTHRRIGFGQCVGQIVPCDK